MKKAIKVAVLAVLCTFATKSNLNAQVFEKGDMVFDTYYGFPNLYTAVFETAYASSVTNNSMSVKSIGPVGGRFEYMVSDRVGLGLDIGFNNSKISYNEQDVDQNFNPVTYNYNFSTQKLGVMATFNYHFLKNTDKFDLYGVFGIGYGNRSYTYESTNPDYVATTIKTPIPIASRLGIGMRYMIIDNVGINLGLGVGQGGLINTGFSFKF